jgi:hypothetical protein
MRKRRIAILVVLILLVAATSVAAARAGPGIMLRANAKGPPESGLQIGGPIPDQVTLLNHPYPVQVEDLTGGERDSVLIDLTSSDEYWLLAGTLAAKGYQPVEDLSTWETLRVTLCRRVYLPIVVKEHEVAYAVLPAEGGSAPLAPSQVPEGVCYIDVLVVPIEAEQQPGPMGYIVSMLGEDGSGFFQAHHTNLDPRLMDVPHTDVMVNGMEYFYVTTLQVVGGQVVPWNYWWYNSHRHPNWYYSFYRHYWDYYFQAAYHWHTWYHWAYGWYYWRFWYYWSTYFPWAEPEAVPLGQQ